MPSAETHKRHVLNYASELKTPGACPAWYVPCIYSPNTQNRPNLQLIISPSTPTSHIYLKKSISRGHINEMTASQSHFVSTSHRMQMASVGCLPVSQNSRGCRCSRCWRDFTPNIHTYIQLVTRAEACRHILYLHYTRHLLHVGMCRAGNSFGHLEVIVSIVLTVCVLNALSCSTAGFLSGQRKPSSSCF